MSAATCPYCGAKLNLGLKFCVVCGRHVTVDSMGKVGGGLRGGFRPADITRRLDELITVARFRRSRRSHELERGTRFVFVNALYLFVATGLFYAALQFSLEMVFPGKFQETRIPMARMMEFFQHQAASIRLPEVKKDPNTDQVVIIDPGSGSPADAAKTKPVAKPAKKADSKSKKSKAKRKRKVPAKKAD
jgi:hypothetical protein